MKKLILFIVVLLASATFANAQVRPDAMPAGHGPNPAEIAAMNTQYVTLLAEQNKLLSRRYSALMVTVAGGCLYEAGSILYSVKVASEQDPSTGTAFAAVGAITMLAGGVWTLINETNLIVNQKKINEHLMLRYSPSGIALEF